MRANDLRRLVKGQPFRPFRFYVLDGTSFDIRHPELVQVAQSTVMVHFPAADDSTVPERYVLVALLHITRIEPLG
jgi:hypothetical protein